MSRKSLLLFFIFQILFCALQAQTSQLLVLKKERLNKELEINNTVAKKKKGIGNALLTVYQKHISVLISADCLYSISCSRYSREVINKHGFFTGVLLTADRLTRCSFFCGKDIPESKFNDDGLAEDNP